MKKTIVFFLAVMTALSFAVGCSKQKLPDGMPELVSFTLTVTQGGQPLEGAAVTLKSDAHTYVVTGLTDGKGVVDMKTSGDYAGAPAGDYKATVTKKVTTPSAFGDQAPPSDKEAAEWQANRQKEYRPTHSYVDKKYADWGTTDLAVSIAAGGSAALEVGAAVDDLEFPEDSAKEPPK